MEPKSLIPILKSKLYLEKSILIRNYKGHTYWLTFPIGLLDLKSSIPAWLNIAVAFGVKWNV
ncbi:MAG: hypothetical protein WAR79_01030 [Melioribacteraceae bacterium]